MDNKIIEKLIEALCVAIVSATIWWIGAVFRSYGDNKVKSRDLARDLAHIKRSQDALSLVVSGIDKQFDRVESKLYDFDTQLALMDARLKFSDRCDPKQLGNNPERR